MARKKKVIKFYNPKTGLWYVARRTRGGKVRIERALKKGRRKKR